jgi:hypothetical protein
MGENTEHTLTHIKNGMLDGLDPKVAVVLIGTNNLGHIPGEKPEWVAASNPSAWQSFILAPKARP